jgi:hypothetical protein
MDDPDEFGVPAAAEAGEQVEAEACEQAGAEAGEQAEAEVGEQAEAEDVAEGGQIATELRVPRAVVSFYIAFRTAQAALSVQLDPGCRTTVLDILLTVFDNARVGKLSNSALGRELRGYIRNFPNGHLLPGADCKTVSAVHAAAVSVIVPTPPDIRPVACCRLCGAGFFGASLNSPFCGILSD